MTSQQRRQTCRERRKRETGEKNKSQIQQTKTVRQRHMMGIEGR